MRGWGRVVIVRACDDSCCTGELEKAIRRARSELRECEKARDKGYEERDAARAQVSSAKHASRLACRALTQMPWAPLPPSQVEALHLQLQARDAEIGNTEQSRAAMEAVSKVCMGHQQAHAVCSRPSNPLSNKDSNPCDRRRRATSYRPLKQT